MFTTQYNKSLIQQELEKADLMENFKEGLDNLLNKYTIENGVFGLNKGSIIESVEGYFVEEGEFDSLNEAIKHSNYPYIHIINNEKFITGSIYEKLNKCPQDKKIFDLSTLEYVK